MSSIPIQGSGISQNLFDQVNTIINNESQIINQQTLDAQNAMYTKEHQIQFNDSYRKRYNEYNKMIIVLVIGLFVFLVAKIAKYFLAPFIGEYIFYLLYVGILATTIIFMVNIYLRILQRDKMNFDELSIPPPGSSPYTGSGTFAYGSGMNSNLNINGTCLGEYCCGPNTIWDPTGVQCILFGSGSGSSIGSAMGSVTGVGSAMGSVTGVGSAMGSFTGVGSGIGTSGFTTMGTYKKMDIFMQPTNTLLYSPY